MNKRERVRVFDRIYRLGLWKEPETRSGRGSTAAATAHVRDWLPRVVEKLGITSVLDAGCGEGLWQPELPGYVGVDVSSAPLRTARTAHPERAYLRLDICEDPLPKTDAILCRDALQHLPIRDAQTALRNFRRSGARWLIASSHRDGENRGVRLGHWYPSNLEAAPFGLGLPILYTPDGEWSTGTRYPNKILGVWEL